MQYLSTLNFIKVLKNKWEEKIKDKLFYISTNVDIASM